MKKVHFLGPRGSYSDMAAQEFLKILGLQEFEVEFIPCPSISNVIERADTQESVYSVVPVENSIEGSVREALDALVKTSAKVRMTKEIVMTISNCLITRAKKLEDIKVISSYTQPIGQCQGYINRNFPDGIEIVSAKSTSEAVKNIVDKPESYAAIGTRLAAELYNLPVLAEPINDQPENYTKFVLLNEHIAEPTGNDLTSIALVIRNKPGALLETLTPFAENNINLCKIESRPSKKSFGDYVFFIDFDGHIEDSRVKQTIGQIVPSIDSYKLLGSYPKFR